MRMNSGIILQGQQPDLIGSAARGFTAGRQNALAGLYKEHGQGIAEGNQNALAALARFDPNEALRAKAGRQAIDHGQERMGFDREKMNILRTNAKNAAADRVAAMDAAAAAAEKERLTGLIQAGAMFFQNGDKEGYEAFASQNGVDVNQYPFEALPANLASLIGVTDALDAIGGPEFSQITGEAATKLGLDPSKSYNVGRDGKVTSIGGGVTVNNNMGGGIPEYSKLPQGFVYKRDAQGNVLIDESGVPTVLPIKGGPEDTTKFDEIKESRADTASDVIVNAATKIRDAAGKQDFGPTGTTVVGKLPWTNSAEVVRQVAVLKAQASAGSLQQMRDASKTGGALGNVTEKELVLLENLAGALDPNAPTFLEDLDRYERTLLRTVHGKDAGDQIFDQSRADATEQPTQAELGDVPMPEGFEYPDLWEHLPPEDKALWK